MLRVFLVEDDQAARESLRDTVPWSQYGYSFAGEAGDGEMALPLIRKARPDVLITDVHMPFMDGLALSKLVRQEFPKMKIILLSELEDFEHIRKSICVGVERYLLKPVAIRAIVPVLLDVKDMLEEEQSQQNFLAQFHQEAQEHAQYTRRSFFERVVAGQLTAEQIYEDAQKLELDVRAQCYTVAFFSVLPERHDMTDHDRRSIARIREGLLTHFLKYPEYILVRWSLTAYAVLIKGDADRMPDYIRWCIQAVQRQYESYIANQNWYVAVGRPTQRLSMLSECFEETAKLWAYRYVFPMQHILTAETVSFLTGTGSNEVLAELDVRKVNPDIVSGILRDGTPQEIPGFVDGYIRSVADALQSKPFCQYLLLSVRFAATEFLQSLGIEPREFLQELNCLDLVGRNVTMAELKNSMADILLHALHLRDEASGNRYRSVLRRAVDYIDSNFTDEMLSLNMVAREVNISPNYLSAIFSQEIGLTFTEYVTGKRMEKAKELLRTTTKRSGEVASAVGYRDRQYFSALFKKTQGCTPRDYRGKKDRK